MFKKISDWYQSNKTKINVIIIIIIILVIIISIKSCRDNNIVATNLKIANDSLNMKIKEYVDDSSNIHAQVQELQLSKSELSTLNESLKNHYLNKIDSLANVLNVKNKEIQSYITVITKTTGQGFGKIDTNYVLMADTTGKNKIDTNYAIHSNDGYLSYNGILKKGILTYDYEYTMLLNAVRFSKKTGFLGLNKSYYWDVSTNNKNAKIVGLEQFTQNPVSKLKRFSVVVGPSIGLDDKFKIRVQPISLTLGIKIVEF